MARVDRADWESISETDFRQNEDLPARGYERTEFSSITARRLSDDLAIVTGSGGETWRIVVAAIHDPDATKS